MSLPVVTHQVEDKGLTLIVRAGAGAICARLTDSEAKRLAWGILNDLDPDAVHQHNLEVMGNKRLQREEWKLGVSPHRKYDPNAKPRSYVPTDEDFQTMLAMRREGQSYDNIAKTLGMSRSKAFRAFAARFGPVDAFIENKGQIA
jgi:hypothetical protein